MRHRGVSCRKRAQYTGYLRKGIRPLGPWLRCRISFRRYGDEHLSLPLNPFEMRGAEEALRVDLVHRFANPSGTLTKGGLSPPVTESMMPSVAAVSPAATSSRRLLYEKR